MIENRIKKWSAVWLALSLVVLALQFGCSEQKSKLSEDELERIALAKKVELVQEKGGLVLLVEGETLSSEEMLESPVEGLQEEVSLVEYLKPMAQNTSLEEFKVQARPYIEDILMTRISNILLYQHAKKETGDNEQVNSAIDGMVEKEWRKFVLRFGGDVAKADAELVKMGSNREQFKAEQRKRIITQSFVASRFPKDEPVTYSQLVECYEQIKDEYFVKRAKVGFRLIDINVMQIPLQGDLDAFVQARNLAEELMKRIRAGEDFAQVAQQYWDKYGQSLGGFWDSVSLDSLAKPYDEIVKETNKIEVGQVAGPIEIGGHLFIVKLESRQKKGYEPFEQVQRQVERYLVNERHNEVIRKIASKYLGQASLGETDEFMNFCLEKIYEQING
jgi:hypothetical protein